MKIVSIVGTRPEIIKSSRILAMLDKYFDHTLIHTGQNYDYELNEIFFDSLKIRKPDIFLNIDNANPISAIAQIIEKTGNVLKELKPDAFYLLGDTNSGLSAISAKKLGIPIFHMEAGNRCFADIPEEINRKIIDHISDFNLVYSEHARTNLLNEGLHPSKIIKVGSPMSEVIDFYRKDMEESNILDIHSLKKGRYIVFSIHREENIDNENKLIGILKSVNKLISHFNMPIFFSIHPRTRKKIELLGLDISNPMIINSPPISFFDYVKLQENSFCVVSDSGSVQEESNICRFPAITLRDSHERPEAIEAGTIVSSKIDIGSIISAIGIVTDSKEHEYIIDYLDMSISEKIVKIIRSNT